MKHTSDKIDLTTICSIIHTIPIPAFVLDLQHRVVAWNLAIEKITRLPASKMLNTACHWQAFYQTERKVLADLVLDDITAGKSTTYKNSLIITCDVLDEWREMKIPGNSIDNSCGRCIAGPVKNEHGERIGVIEFILPGAIDKETRFSLLEFSERYETFLEKVEDGYVEVNLKGDVTFCNSAYAKIVGYAPERIYGANYRNHMSKEISDRVFNVYNSVYKTGIPIKAFDYEIQRRDGSMRNIEISISLKKNAYGEVSGFRSFIRDITDRKKEEQTLIEQRSRLEAIFQSVQDAIITVDTNLCVIDANAAAKSICGIDSESMYGKPLMSSVSQCGGACQELLLNTLNDKRSFKAYHIECRQRNDQLKKASISTAPLVGKGGDFLGAVLVIRDITRLANLERELKERHCFQNIIGKSKPMQEIFSLLEDLNDMETTVLITGESGTGKELVARALHYGGSRRFKSFVTVNCSALAENLLESELFGHIKGAFTGAIKDTVGRFQTADKGTILLDEIGDISPRIQLKLLRVLQEKEFERVGDSAPIKVDVRVIACTNRDMKQMVASGEFREDLYYRLKVMEIQLPPLRERKEDVPLLIQHFIQHFNRKYKKTIQTVTHDVLKAMMNYSWPGNIRELEHAIERAFVLCRKNVIEVAHLPHEILGYPVTYTSLQKKRHTIDTPEELLDALRKTGWNKSKAARLLGIHRRTLYRKLERYNMTEPEETEVL